MKFKNSTGVFSSLMSGKVKTIVNQQQKIGRNELCPCGSKIKFKHCCLKKVQQPNV